MTNHNATDREDPACDDGPSVDEPIPSSTDSRGVIARFDTDDPIAAALDLVEQGMVGMTMPRLLVYARSDESPFEEAAVRDAAHERGMLERPDD